MKNKFLLVFVIFCIVLSISLCSCDNTDTENKNSSKLDLIRISRHDDYGAEGVIDWIEYYYHKDTGVVYMYVVNSNGNGISGGIAPLYKADGTIMTYEEFMQNENQ
jgi:hypothetical protein